MVTVDELVDELRKGYDINPGSGEFPDGILKHWASEFGLAEDKLLDAVASRLASGFASQEFDFSFCSDTIARFQSSAFPNWPPFFWEVYIAFDAGEFYHDERRDADPSETHTRPMIEAILKEKSMNGTSLGDNSINQDV